jgi:hypothetical protein
MCPIQFQPPPGFLGRSKRHIVKRSWKAVAIKHILTILDDYTRDLDWEIGFIDHLQVVTTSNYNTIANFHTLQITTAHAKSFQSAVTIPGNGS